MNNVKITVILHDFPYHEYVSTAVVEIPPDLMRNCGPIDYPAPDTDRMTAELFCTPIKVRDFVEQNRKRLAQQITKQVLECLSASDTIMGYRKEIKNGYT